MWKLSFLNASFKANIIMKMWIWHWFFFSLYTETATLSQVSKFLDFSSNSALWASAPMTPEGSGNKGFHELLSTCHYQISQPFLLISWWNCAFLACPCLTCSLVLPPTPLLCQDVSFGSSDLWISMDYFWEPWTSPQILWITVCEYEFLWQDVHGFHQFKS